MKRWLLYFSELSRILIIEKDEWVIYIIIAIEQISLSAALGKTDIMLFEFSRWKRKVTHGSVLR